jgi:alcohol dehydrogenase (cytochrome c)
MRHTTASNVLFTGGREGYFFALDARNGKMLWKASVGRRMPAGPMTYSFNGRQYVRSPQAARYTSTLRQ